ncbi:hypothetical protein IW140_000168 [Coemansia sp. RSA 1813]|nr:hypothetical protein IW140_000168 [Coemansia sp. RSA 1813]
MVVEAKVAPTTGKIPDKTMGQLLDYVNVIWTEQPTRTFTPILYIHGEIITLFVFTRGPWYRIELGKICYTDTSPDILDVETIRMSLLRLWLIVTLPANKFGHFCDVNTESPYIQFSRPDASTKLANAVLADSENPNTLLLDSRISRIVNPYSRLAYLFDTTYKSKRAVLKLSWTPVKRLPESAVYDILHQTGVEGVPEVYDSGLIRADYFGYRLEYIILEHCGESLGIYVVECRKRGVPDSEIHKNANQFICQVSNCLVQARARGILHRDISDENIAVRNGQAKVIDWGYAKIIESNSSGVIGIDPAVADKVAQQWGFDKEAVLENEGTWDPLTGTVLFMSVPVLFGMPKRGLFDDIESLFYVVLRAFADSEDCCGFKHYDNKTLALTRVGILGCESGYLELFSVKSDLGALQETVDAMLKFLFYLGNKYVGHELFSNGDHERLPDLRLAKKLMDEKAVNDLKLFLPIVPVKVGSGTTRKRNAAVSSPGEATNPKKASRGSTLEGPSSQMSTRSQTRGEK